MDTSILKHLEDEINNVVDSWVSGALRDRFMQKPVGQKPRSLWDRFKQGVTNWWWGPKGDKYNPYKWKNRFGDNLGSTVEHSRRPEMFDPSIFTLQDYRDIRDLVESIEMRLDESADTDGEFDKLRLMNLLKSAASDLKGMLYHAIKRKLATVWPAASSAADSGGLKPGSYLSTNIEVDPDNLPPNMKQRLEPEPVKDAAQSNAPSANKPDPQPASKPRARTTSSRNRKPAEKKASSTPPKQDAAEKRKISPQAKSDEDSPDEVVDGMDLRGYFYTEKDEPLDFVERIESFLKTEKYKPHRAGLRPWWKSELVAAENKGQDRDEQKNWLRANLWGRLVTGDGVIKKISEISGFSKDEVKQDMIQHLKSIS